MMHHRSRFSLLVPAGRSQIVPNFSGERKTMKTVHITERLAAILGMLGSEHDGEVLNAARQAEAERRRLSVTWGDLLAPPVGNNARPADRHKVKALTVKRIEAAIKARRDTPTTLELSDHIVDGLALRVGRRKATWTLRYKFNGRQYRKKLDHLPLEAKEARRAAQAALDRLGQDPDQDPFPQVDPKAKKAVLYVAEQYFERQLKKRKAAAQIERMIRQDVLGQVWNETARTWDIDRSKKLHWRDRRIASITRRDARDVRDVVYARACAKPEAPARARPKAEQR